MEPANPRMKLEESMEESETVKAILEISSDEWEEVSEESLGGSDGKHGSDEEWFKIIPAKIRVLKGAKAKSRSCKKHQLKKTKMDPWAWQWGANWW